MLTKPLEFNKFLIDTDHKNYSTINKRELRKIALYFRSLRPSHWIKNFLVFAPPFFAAKLLVDDSLLKGICLFFTFSAVASCVYVINDLTDKNEDRMHPVKKTRPIASGRISNTEALLLVVLTFSLAALFCLFLPMQTIAFIAVYFVTNLLYSFWLKKLVLVDIFVVSIMYLYRIFASEEVWGIKNSHWIILCTFFLALFLISAKRRAEFHSVEESSASTRMVLRSYSKEFLDHLMMITMTTALVTYGLYVISMDKPYLLYSIVFVAFALFRYMYLVYKRNVGQSPEQTLVRDPWIVSSILLWVIYNGFILHTF